MKGATPGRLLGPPSVGFPLEKRTTHYTPITYIYTCIHLCVYIYIYIYMYAYMHTHIQIHDMRTCAVSSDAGV